MGGLGSGRPAAGLKDKRRLTNEERIERNRVRARERWQRLRDEREKQPELKGKTKYNLYYREKYNKDEERIGHLRQPGKTFKIEEDPIELIKEIKETNKRRLDEILNDPKAMERIFSDRDDIPFLQKQTQRRKTYYTAKEIKEMERKLNEEFNLVEDRKQQSTFKPKTDDNNE